MEQLKRIQEALKYTHVKDMLKEPEEFFKRAQIHSIQKGNDEIDEMAKCVYTFIQCNDKLKKSKVCTTWIECFDEFYVKPMYTTPKLSESTKKQYKRNLIYIQTKIHKDALYNIIHTPRTFFKKLEVYCNETSGRMNEKLGDHFKDGMVASLMSLFLHNERLRNKKHSLFKEWETLHKKVREPLQKKYMENSPTPRQKRAYISFEEIEKKRDSLPIGSIEKVLLSMYTRIAPLRSDFATLEIKREKAPQDASSGVYLYGKKGILVLTDYKTAKTYGVLKIELPKMLVCEIEDSLQFKPRKTLFVSETGKEFATYNQPERRYNDWANTVLKRLFSNDAISLTTLRHIYISRKDLNLSDMTGTEREKIAKQMGHSVSTQNKYLWK